MSGKQVGFIKSLITAEHLFGKIHFSGVRTIIAEKNCPPIRIKVSFRVSVRIRVGGNFPRGQLS